MTSQMAVSEKTGASSQDLSAQRLNPLALLVLSAWCGLVSGLLEVGTIVLRKRMIDVNHLYHMSRHFIWLIPLINLVIFLTLALFFLIPLKRGRGRWFMGRLLAVLTLVPPLWAAFPQIYGPAGLILVLGVASWLVPMLERHGVGFRRLVRLSFPVITGLVLIVAASAWGVDRIGEWREASRPLPPPDSPNVLLIILDTVGAEHLSLYGYQRPTSPTIDELALRAVRFDRAQATCSWTLPSHASMFTGRWPHELSTGWLTPLDGVHTTLAEFLGSRGYATAGFVGNTFYCAVDSGLGRGFTEYRDDSLPRLTAFKTTVLVDRPLEGLRAVGGLLEEWFDCGLLRPVVNLLWWLFKADQKEAEVVNREFLDWLSRRRQPARPFFAFLNFYDAHVPYRPRPTTLRRFGVSTDDDREIDPVPDEFLLTHRAPSAQKIALVRNAYDDCVADLDEQLGLLIDELDHRAVLERTWVIITADHGESFGEHAGVFQHGMSLYQTELHVPLLIIPPPGKLSQRVVKKTVSLRDLAATLVDIVDFKAGSPFPGESLARFWSGSPPPVKAGPEAPDQALSELVPLDPFDTDPVRAAKPRWPLAALIEGDRSYIRRDGDVREMLFDLRDDAKEFRNLAGDPAMQPTLEHMRAALYRLTTGPLTPQRFNP